MPSICYDYEQAIRQLEADSFQKGDKVRFAPLVMEKTDENGKTKYEPYAAPKKGKPWVFVEFEELKKRLRKGETLEQITGIEFNPFAGVWYASNPCISGTDDGVTRFINLVIESDDIPKEKQLELIKKSGLKFNSLVDSGGKSIHAHCPLIAKDKHEHKKVFSQVSKMLEAFGFPVDQANKNPNRFTRLGGCYRGNEKQELLEVRTQEIEPYRLNPVDSNTSLSTPQRKRAQTQGITENQALIIYALENLLDPEKVSYDDWHMIICVCKYEGVVLEVLDEWCKKDPERYDFEVLKRKYDEANTSNDPFDGQARFGTFCEYVRGFYPDFNTPNDKHKANPKKAGSRKAGKPSKTDLFLEDAQRALNELHTCLLNESILHVYDLKKGYICNTPVIRQKIAQLFRGTKRPQEVTETLKYLEDNSPQKTEETANYIQFENCILDLKEKRDDSPISVLERSPDKIIKNTVPWSYETVYPWTYEPLTGTVMNSKGERNLKAEFVEKTLDEWACGDDDMKTLMLECVGQAMLTTVPIHGFFLLIGDTRNGKSAFCNFLREVLGFANTSAVPLDELESKFSGEGLYGKLANIAEENKGKYMSEQAVLKNISAGGTLKLEGKGKPVTQVRCKSTQIFSFNQDFRIDDKARALAPRTNAILFRNDFTDPAKQDQYLDKKLAHPECIQHLIQRGVQAIKAAICRGDFTKPELSTEWIKQQTELNDSTHVIEFLKAIEENESMNYTSPYPSFRDDVELKGVGEERLLENSTEDLFKAYCHWCEAAKNNASCKNTWSKAMCKHGNLTTKQKKIKGHPVRFFVKKED